jgi:dTDP-glucose pyrophosphorylase
MYMDAEARRAELEKHNEKDGPVFKIANDPRITRVGKFLRRTSLDELPQLFNILKGDMSFVGPRPLIGRGNERAVIDEREKSGANDVRPGLTGWAQINGRDLVDNGEKAKLDGEYVRRQSFWFDCRCFFRTIGKVITHDGVVEGRRDVMNRDSAKTQDVTLVILAAGIGSRYGGVKQLAPVGPGGEVIIDYSIHDALAAGFNKIVFILRRDIFSDFRETLGDRLEEIFRAHGVRWEYVFQELTDPPEGRTKPWGTGQALLCCAPVLHEPFAVINADDYYGREAYDKAADFLRRCDPARPDAYGMVGFVLKNTLSDNGGVTRGICVRDENGLLTGINETHDIVKTPDGAAADGRALDTEALVSMNLWMLTPAFTARLEDGFAAFRRDLADPLKSEYLLPDIVDRLLKSGEATVEVLSTEDKWFGVTYHEDLPAVQEAIAALHAQGVYREPLYSDIP